MNYQGSYCALITPFKNGKVDEKSFKNIIKWHIKSGTKGIIPCGTTESLQLLATKNIS